MNKYTLAMEDLELIGTAKMKGRGNSMLPILKNGSLMSYEKRDEYEVGDIVFCKVRGKYIDAHWIKKKNKKRGYLIANNRGHENGWTHQVYGKVVKDLYRGVEHSF